MNKYRLFFVFTFLDFLALYLLTPTPHTATAAGPWYVSTASGSSDSNDCLTPTTSCASINGALAKPGFSDGDTIKVAIGTYYGTGNEVVLLSRSATISGGWDASFTSQTGMSTIDGQGARRGVTVSGGTMATLEKLVISNGTAPSGGGIDNAGSLSLNSSTVSTNHVTWHGGGIYNGGTLTATNSVVQGNSASWAEGGGIYNINGTLTLNNTVIDGNSMGVGSILNSV